jgi:hypothetical protein
MYGTTRNDTLEPIAKFWFDLKTEKIPNRFKDLKVNVLDFYPFLVGCINVVFFLGLISFTLLDGFKENRIFNKAVILIFSLWLINFSFSIFASPIVLRFQLFPIISIASFSFLFMEKVIMKAFLKEEGIKSNNVQSTIHSPIQSSAI